MIGEKISPILVEIEGALFDFNVSIGTRFGFTDDGFRAAIKIFMDVMLDKMWSLQCNEKIDMEDRCKMANKLGQELHKLIKIYTDVDTKKIYDDYVHG